MARNPLLFIDETSAQKRSAMHMIMEVFFFAAFFSCFEYVLADCKRSLVYWDGALMVCPCEFIWNFLFNPLIFLFVLFLHCLYDGSHLHTVESAAVWERADADIFVPY